MIRQNHAARDRREVLVREIQETSDTLAAVEEEAGRALVVAPADGVPHELRSRMAVLKARRSELLEELRLIGVGLEMATTRPR